MLDPPSMLKMQYKPVKNLSWLQAPKINCYRLSNASPYAASFTFIILL